jgi:hypothetical protein
MNLFTRLKKYINKQIPKKHTRQPQVRRTKGAKASRPAGAGQAVEAAYIWPLEVKSRYRSWRKRLAFSHPKTSRIPFETKISPMYIAYDAVTARCDGIRARKARDGPQSSCLANNSEIISKL